MNNAISVLIVDDEIYLCDLLGLFFEIEGFRVLKALNGSEAIKVIKEEPSINFVISDVRMPEGDGVFLLNYVKQNCSSEMQVILLSGFTDYSEEELLKMGASAFFAKPTNPCTLADFVRSKVKITSINS